MKLAAAAAAAAAVASSNQQKQRRSGRELMQGKAVAALESKTQSKQRQLGSFRAAAIPCTLQKIGVRNQVHGHACDIVVAHAQALNVVDDVHTVTRGCNRGGSN